MTSWAPHDPDALGLDWFPSDTGARIINASQKAAAIKIRSTAAESIDSISLYLPLTMRERVASGDWMIEVFEEGEEIPGAVSTATYRVNGVDTNVNSSWKDNTGATLATGNVVAAISEDDLDTTTYTQYTGTYASKDGVFFEFNTNSPSGAPTGAGPWGANRRVVGGRLFIVANRAEASGQLQVYFRAPGGGNYAIGQIAVDTDIREFSLPWPEQAPFSGLPWAETDIEDLDDTASIRIKPVGIGRHKPLRIYQMWLELDYVTENRVAVAKGDSDALSASLLTDWPKFETYDPLTGGIASWSKANNTTYTFLLRRIPKWRNLGTSTAIETGKTEGGQMAWGFIAEVQDTGDAIGRDSWLPDGFMASYNPALNQDGTVATLGDPGVRGYGIHFDSGTSPDGQPYAFSAAIIGGGIGSVGTGQSLTAGATAEHPVLRFILLPAMLQDDFSWVTDNLDPDDFEDIEIKVKRESTDVQIGSTYTIGYEDLNDFPRIPVTTVEGYLVEVRLEGINLTNGVQYYVEFASDQPVNFGPVWVLPIGRADTAESVENPTFDTSVERQITTNGTTITGENESADVFLTLSQAPAAPTGFSVLPDTQILITDTDAHDSLVNTLEYASINWNATALGADFVAYEIQRSDDGGVTWHTIFRITVEATEEANDYEGLRNVEATYRMRVIAAWHVGSDWTAEDTITVDMTDCALLFTSNEDPDLNQGYVDIGGSRTWTFLSADERTTRSLVGRNYQIVTAPLEYRGDSFEVELAVWGATLPADTGRAIFDRLEVLNGIATSYICVLDETGRRWYGDVAISEGTRMGTKEHRANARIIEITDTPSIVDVG